MLVISRRRFSIERFDASIQLISPKQFRPLTETARNRVELNLITYFRLRSISEPSATRSGRCLAADGRPAGLYRLPRLSLPPGCSQALWKDQRIISFPRCGHVMRGLGSWRLGWHHLGPNKPELLSTLPRKAAHS